MLSFVKIHLEKIALLMILLSSPVFSEPLSPDWTRTARIIGANLFWEMSDEELFSEIDSYAEQNVSVMVVWSPVSDGSIFWSEDDYIFLKRVVEYTHSGYPDLKIFVYAAPLENQTTDVDLNRDGKLDKGKVSSFSEHPGWLQVGIDGRPAVFYGSIAFWLDETSEDVWFCPNDPEIRALWIDNFKKLASTGIDGIWWDVPFFSHYFGDDWNEQWACHCSDCKEKFKNEYGSGIPDKEDWNNSDWLKFINWRYSSMGEFIKQCKDAAQSVNPDILLYNEAWNPISQFEPQSGFDPDLARARGYNEGTVHEFEPADPKNYGYYSWILNAAMGINYRGIDSERPSWVLSYSHNSRHAEKRCANLLFSGCNFYEVGFPLMSSTAGYDVRKKLFGWIKKYGDYFYAGEIRSAAGVAVYYSPLSLAYYGKSNEPYDIELKGIEMMLLESHIPFSVLPADKIDKIGMYDLVILPNVTVLTSSELEIIKAFAAGGGKVLSTGQTASLTGDGEIREKPGFSDVAGDELETESVFQKGYRKGLFVFTGDNAGSRFFIAADPERPSLFSGNRRAEKIREYFMDGIWSSTGYDSEFKTDAPGTVIFNLFESEKSLYLRVENLTGVRLNRYNAKKQKDIKVVLRTADAEFLKDAYRIDFLGGISTLDYEITDDTHIKFIFDIKDDALLVFNK